MSSFTTNSFGALLRQLRRRADMTQGDLAAAVGYSISFISSLEQNSRQPDVHTVMQHFVPALGLQEEPHFAARLLELAMTARGDLPPAALMHPRETHVVVPAAPSEPPAHLPTPPTTLIGRQQEVKTLCNRLFGHTGRLLTLVGPPGIGKTRLGLAVAAQLQEVYREGACFVPLAAIRHAEFVASAIVAALGIADTSQKLPRTRLIEFLRHKELLLLLDNFEQLIAPHSAETEGGVELVAELLSECPRLRVLVTSRERLHLRAEQRYRVQPLGIVPACELFIQRAQTVDTAFEPRVENQAVIEEICRRLDCLPLAIELSAAHVELLTLPALLVRVQNQRLDLLSQGARDLPVRHRTLRNAIQHSYALLDEQERSLFHTLSVFVGGFDLAAVAHFGFDEATLQALVSKSLVQPTAALVMPYAAGKNPPATAERRFLLLETLREYACEKLVERGEAVLLRDQHAAYFLQLAEQARPLLYSAQQQVWYQRLIVEQSNFRAALHWWRAANQYTQVARLGAALCWFWWKHGDIREETPWSEWALSEMNRHQTTTPSAVRAKALYAVAFGAECFGDLARARSLYEEYLQIEAQPSSFIDCYEVLGGLAAILELAGDTQRAKILEEHRLALAREHAFPNGVADALMQLGQHALSQGDTTRASQLLQESLTLRKAVGTVTGVAHTQALLGVVACEQGDFAQALLLLQQALELSRSLDDKHGIGWIFSDLGVVAQLQQAYEKAYHYQRDALALARESGYQFMVAVVVGRLGTLALLQEDLERARTCFVESITICRQLGLNDRLAGALEGLAGVEVLSGRPRQATQLLGAAETCRQASGSARPIEQRAIYERTVALAQAALGESQFDAACLTGRTTALNDVIAQALGIPNAA